MKVAFITSEAVPFSKTGGLGDVAGVLPQALARLGVDVSVYSPLYSSVRKHPLEELPNLITVPIGQGRAWGAVRKSGRFFFLEHDQFYGRPNLYGNGQGDYPDNLQRFVFLMRGALEHIAQSGRAPDVIHAHDWQTGLLPLYLKTLYAGAFPKTKSVFTVHNLAYQGRFWKEMLPLTGIGWNHFTFLDLEYYDGINFMKGGLVHADALTTVSPTYAHEIQHPVHGWGMDGVLRGRASSLRGILNGVDYDEWDPEKDPHLAVKYSARAMNGKSMCKAALQRRCGLPARPEVPVIAIVGRLAEQKGVDLFVRGADGILHNDVQVVVLGSGEPWLQDAMLGVADRHRGKCSVHIAFDNAFAHQIMAGADLLLVPSKYEPCGLILPSSGQALVLGLDCQAQGVEARAHMGYLPGELKLYESLTRS
ncbi:MAG: glycogen/starch synthase [Planctomycetes bacterium]|nr:glycogen/starch synthase [Planctomycetota bacterium]